MRHLVLLSSALIASVAAAQAPRSQSPAAPGSPNSISAPQGELLPDEQIQQVLNRLTFGPRPGDAERVRAIGIDKWIDLQLNPDRIPDPSGDDVLKSYSVFSTPTGDMVRQFEELQRLQRQAKRDAGNDTTMNKQQERREVLAQNPQLMQAAQRNQQMVGQIQSAQLARAISTERQLNEIMVDFWENHFSVFAGKGQTRLYLAQYDRDVIRPHALGKFRDLLGAVAHSPAMLFFLDNWQSAADSTQPTLAQARRPMAMRRPGRFGIFAPPPRPVPQQQQQRARRGLNENYARELMELHTLGVDGGYTQKDVQEVARALTGWTFNRQSGEFLFNPMIHDAGEKTILGQKFPAGRGEDEGERVLDIVASHPSTAHFIVTKLARHFVSDDPPKSLVDRCASTFSKTAGDIRETLRCVVTSPEFFSRSAYRAKVKTPFEVVASALRAVNASPDPTPRTAQLVARLGQPIFGRQTPDGWPDRGDAWMNTGAILNRINFGLALAAGQIPGAPLTNWSDFSSLRTQPRTQQVDAVVKSMLGGQVSSETRQVLMSGENPMLSTADANAMADSSAMNFGRRGAGGGRGAQQQAKPDGKGFPRGPGAQIPGFGRPVNLQGLPQVVGLALGAPEFQRR
ncbi:MAG TPA: DUF1800 domain-containing protein [Gemmatimonadaceae bacterium]|jgi:uncharacterized protein (DUF1800 family)|nr:DUF1800 domain-containing protein [Gemmatimonadaceae bacterium]